MKYTKEDINGVVFTSGNSKYRVVYPGTLGRECDLYHFHDGLTKQWNTIDEFNRYVANKQFTIVEEPQLYSIY
jgi:hypothetical protein